VRARWIESWDGPLEAGERPDPEPGPGELLVRVEACGVGLTVLNCIRGDLGTDPDGLPRIPGHELVGSVVATGPGVGEERVGERVMAYFYLFCGGCRACLSARESICERLGGYVGVNLDGGYGELATLPARNAIPLPGELDPVAATAIPDAIATPVHVARRAGIERGDRVAVIAAGGGVGVHMLQVAAVHGAEVAALEATGEKLAFAEELGAVPIDSSDFARAALPASWRDGADVVVDLLGRPESLAWSLGALATGGRLVVLTTFRDVSADLSPRELVLRQASVLGSRYASRHELLEAARLVQEERVRPVVTKRAGYRQVDELHAALREGSLLGRGAIDWALPA
jgi:D-arabinose 1-dehydrogenase-like Zn-dependent alcohol dehydrogenase